MSTDRFELELLDAVREEAYSEPLSLSPDQLRTRLTGRSRRRATIRWPIGASLIMIATLVGVAVAVPRLAGLLGPGTREQCEVSATIRHGDSWYREIGGPAAFFNADPAQFYASQSGWPIHVRFHPAPRNGDVQMWAESIGRSQRVQALLGEPADPSRIFRFDIPAPALPGDLYLFQQPLPHEGCWRLVAAVGGEIVGTAVVEVSPGSHPDSRPGRTRDAGASTPRTP